MSEITRASLTHLSSNRSSAVAVLSTPRLVLNWFHSPLSPLPTLAMVLFQSKPKNPVSSGSAPTGPMSVSRSFFSISLSRALRLMRFSV